MAPTIASKDEFPPLPSQAYLSKRKRKAKVPPSQTSTASNAVMTLDKLPNELLLHIIGYLPALNLENFQLSAILSLSLTSRHLNSVVIDSLYSDFNSFFCNPYLFLRTMMSDPDAAQRVRKLNLNYGNGVHEDRKKYYPSVEDKRKMKAGFKSLGLSDWKTWATDCNEIDVDQEMLYTAIMMHTPNVSMIVIDDGKTQYSTPKWIELMNHAVSGASFEGMHKFSHLRSVEIDLGATLKLRQLSVLFRFPSLRTLKLVGLVENEKSLTDNKKAMKWPISAGSSSIKTLQLIDCWLETRILTTIIDSCRALEYIRYVHRDERCYYRRGQLLFDGDGFGFDDDQFNVDSVLDFVKIGNSLNRHRRSLKTLHIDSEEHMTRNMISDFHRFEKLEDVKIPFNGLVDTSIGALIHVDNFDPASLVKNLPSSVHRLELAMNWVEKTKRAAGLSALEYLAAESGKRLPKLKQVSVHCDVAPVKIEFRKVSTLFHDAGIAFEINFRDFIGREESSSEESYDPSDDEVSLYSSSEDESGAG